MIYITSTLSIDETDLRFSAVRASGPGGQHVNNTASAVQLKFNAANHPGITPAIFSRLKALVGKRMNTEGEITLSASSDRSQHRNKAEAQARLIALLKEAVKPPRLRKKTRPTKASKTRRLEAKAHTAARKKYRSRVRSDD